MSLDFIWNITFTSAALINIVSDSRQWLSCHLHAQCHVLRVFSLQ